MMQQSHPKLTLLKLLCTYGCEESYVICADFSVTNGEISVFLHPSTVNFATQFQLAVVDSIDRIQCCLTRVDCIFQRLYSAPGASKESGLPTPHAL